MKKISFLIITIVALKISYAQRIGNPEARINPCPPGQCVTEASFVFDQFNFHKPRTNCTSGFGLCVRGHIEYECGYSDCIGVQKVKTGIENDKVIGWFTISENKLEMHLPAQLQNTGEFSTQDLSVFYIDDDMIEVKRSGNILIGKLKGGQYPVVLNNSELIILIDIIR